MLVTVDRAMRSRILTVVPVLALLAAACGEATPQPEATEPAVVTTVPAPQPSPPRPTEALPLGQLPEGPSALRDMTSGQFPPPLVDPSQIISGGPPPDGIPPIDEPRFVSVEEADQWLEDAEPVVYMQLDGEVHAHPVQILMWHEIVNDTIAGVPVAVTYCPLCNSAVSYSREINGVVTTFGTSGRLFASALVMYDRATESLWTHFDGRAVVGVLAGEQLDPIPSPLLAWSDFKAAFPGGRVLDRDATGHNRPYGNNPYVGYDNPDATPFLFRGDLDDRARAMQRVVGVTLDDSARAWTLEAVSGGEAQATNSSVGDAPVVILWRAGQASGLDDGSVAGGRDVGSVGVFSPEVDGQVLTFTADGDVFRDEETASEWDITGAAIAGPLSGTRLEQFHHLDTFWFSWSTYQPGTDLVE